jgi:hypothetical protein
MVTMLAYAFDDDDGKDERKFAEHYKGDFEESEKDKIDKSEKGD